jgi:hypothetical protein
MKVRAVRDVSGVVMNDTNGLRRGQIVDWPESYALLQLHAGVVEHPDHADQSREDRKFWADKARDAMIAKQRPHLDEIARQYAEMRGESEKATKADAKRRLGWH